jgi:hypothetical protein
MRGGSYFGVARLFLAALLFAIVVLGSPLLAAAVGPDAVMTPTGYNTNSVARGDDTSNLIVNLPFTMNWNGTNYTQIYINMNGNCTFGGGYTGYNPSTTLAGTNANIMAPFFADVDTRNTAAGQVTYSRTTAGSIPQVNGRNAFFVNWINVASYNNQSTPTNSFQLVLVDRSDTGAGNFDFIFNYDQIAWDIATAASSAKARAGWARNGTSFELPGSGTAQNGTSTLLDTSSSATSLIQNMNNTENQLGRYVFQVRSGVVPNAPPTLTVVDRVLEGNDPTGYVGYVDTGDATAADFDGSIASLTNNRPDPLPLGTSNVTWTATDNQGAITTKIQTIQVKDTTAPSNPSLTSPTHGTGSWSGFSSVTVKSSGAADTCSGIKGFSYSWSQNSPVTPDSTLDPATTVNTTITVTSVDSESFDTNTWPAAWFASNTNYIRLTNANGRQHGTYAIEIRPLNNTNIDEYTQRVYDLTDFTSATLSYWDVYNGSGGSDYTRAQYSTDGGASFTDLRYSTADSGWTQRTYDLPVGGPVIVRFAASVNRSSEYANFDDVVVQGPKNTVVQTAGTSTTTTLADGTWYFNLRTLDNAGNWSAATNMGPFMIDTLPPVTTDNVPASWSTSPLNVTLTPTDAGVIAYTRYSVNGSALSTYTAAIPISVQGTSTLLYWSADTAGHNESTRTATIRIDTGAPSVPTSVAAGAISTSSIEVTWAGSTDLVSGFSHYRVYRNGFLVDTTTSLIYTDTGLTPGQTYAYRIAAVDIAGNISALTTPLDEAVPSSQIWLEISETNIQMGSMDPGTVSSVSSATVVTVGGIGNLTYDFYCLGYDFINANPMSPTPTMPVNLLKFTTRGWVSAPVAGFQTATTAIDRSSGVKFVWQHPYVFDYTLSVPFSYEPGNYTASITYTAVVN